MVMMKREREREVDSITMANYLMLLSGGAGGGEFESTTTYLDNNRVFECKTCNRQFPSFQALGGHRASHKKPRLMGDERDSQLMVINEDQYSSSPPKAKTHECSICGLEFAIGQALGGHMRRHRATTSSSGNSNSNSNSVDTSAANRKKGISRKRVLLLDLNLTPLENDLKFLKIGQPTPLVDCFN